MTDNIFPYEIPDNWQWSTLGNVCSFIGGGTPNKKISKYWNGNIFWASVKDIKGDYLFNTIDKITEEGLKNSSANLCAVGDVILVTRISPATSIISKIITAINQDLKIVKTSLPPKFLHYFFENFKSELESMASGSTVKGITIERLKKFPIPVPPIDEQKRIVAIIESLFEKLDAAKSIVQKILDGYELRRAAILHKAFTGELTKKLRKYFNITLDDWQEKKLGDISESQYGYTAKSLRNELLPKLLRITDIQNGFVDWKKVPNCQIENAQLEKYLLHDKDIVIARTGATTGKSFILKNPVNSVFASYLIRLKILKMVEPDYCYYFLQSNFYWNQIFDLSAGIAQPGVNAKKLQTIKLPIPPLSEQKEIVRVLDSLLDKEQRTKTFAEKILSEIDLLKRTILARAFRGELLR